MTQEPRVGALLALLIVTTGTWARNASHVELSFDSFMGYLQKQHGPLKEGKGSFDIQAMKDEDSLPYLPNIGSVQTTQTALAYFNRTCRLIKSSQVAASLAATSDELKANIDTLRQICGQHNNDGLDDEASSSLVEFLDIELELFEQVMCLEKHQRLGLVKCESKNPQIPLALLQLFSDIKPILQSNAQIKEAKEHVTNYCAYLKHAKQRDYAQSKDFRFSMKLFDDFYQCYCEGRRVCGHRLRVAFKQYDEDLGRAFQKKVDAFFKSLEAKSGHKIKSSVGKKYSTALGTVKCGVRPGGNCTVGSCTALQLIRGNVSACTGREPSLDFHICSEFVKEISEVMKRFPFVVSKNVKSLLSSCVQMRNSKLVLGFGILTSKGAFPSVPFLNFRTSIDVVFSLRFDSTLPRNDTAARDFLNKGWGKYHYGKFAVDSRIETYEFWSRKWSCLSCRRLVEKAFPLSLQKGAVSV